MLHSKRFLWVICVVALFTLPAILQGQEMEMPGVKSVSSQKFGPLPVLPACTAISVQHGDPFKGAAIILLKAASGCVIPWHWHTATEQLILIGGKGKVAMKGSETQAFNPGDYAFLPAKHTHQFSCLSSCTLYVITDGAFDIHYVDKDGTEIPMDQVVKKP